MQDKKKRKSNRERSESTRHALVLAARNLFCDKGYAETGTPEIAATAAVTRGALYHHFTDKADLFRAVVEGEAAAVSAQIEKNTERSVSARDAVLDGTDAYFAAMAVPGRARLLLIDGPAILGPGEMRDIDRNTGGQSLKAGLAGIVGPDVAADELQVLAELLSAAFDRAALAVVEGEAAQTYRIAIEHLLHGLSRTGV